MFCGVIFEEVKPNERAGQFWVSGADVNNISLIFASTQGRLSEAAPHPVSTVRCLPRQVCGDWVTRACVEVDLFYCISSSLKAQDAAFVPNGY